MRLWSNAQCTPGTGVMKDALHARDEGSPQGDSATPFLANMLMDDLDKGLERHRLPIAALTRYTGRSDGPVTIANRRLKWRRVKSLRQLVANVAAAMLEPLGLIPDPGQQSNWGHGRAGVGLGLAFKANDPRNPTHENSVSLLERNQDQMTVGDSATATCNGKFRMPNPPSKKTR